MERLAGDALLVINVMKPAPEFAVYRQIMRRSIARNSIEYVKIYSKLSTITNPKDRNDKNDVN